MSSVIGSLSSSYGGSVQKPYQKPYPRRPKYKGLVNNIRQSLIKSSPYSSYFSSQAQSNSPTRDSLSSNSLTRDSLNSNSLTRVSINSNSAQGLVGLRNLGNTCFMNSILQCLSNTQSVRDYCLDNSYSRDLNSCTSGSSTNNTVLMQEFAKLMQTMWTSSSSSKVVSPFEFKAQFMKFAPVFEGLNQHDAHEFLRYLLDGLHNEVNRVTVGPNASDVEDFDHLPDEEKGKKMWSKYLERENSKIVDLFAGQLKSSLTCSKCGFCAIVFDPFWTLSLPIAEGVMVSLMDCMRLFTKEDILDGDEKPTCCNCKAKSTCTKKFTVQKFPKILVLHLKRFSEGRGTTSSKLKTLVSFPVKDLDLREFASENSMNAAVYNLHAVSTHSGTTRNDGHYTAYCRNPTSGQWHTFNDSRVATRVLCGQVCSFDAYVLFYELASSRGCEPPLEDSQIDGVMDGLRVMEMESDNTHTT